jgi:EAL domain-containing protein (putative c-di-GMP-specific phosphodiesterase class I)
MQEPFQLGDERCQVSFSIGITICPDDSTDLDDLLKKADHAMYAAKRRGDHGYVFHEHDISAQAQERLRMSRELRRALREGEFRLHYQPQVDIESGTIGGWEALLRWQHPERGLLTAGTFVDDLERIGLISDVGRWAIDTVCRQLATWRDEGLPPTRVSLNIAPRHLAEGSVAAELAAAMSRHEVSSAELEVEITEAGIQSGEEIRAEADAVRLLGVDVAIDDFGTGYSSLASLRTLRVDSLKIDRCFVQWATTEETDYRLLRSIIDLGKAFNCRLVAEGIETREQLELLRSLGCNLIQGFLFSPAVAPENVRQLIDGLTSTNAFRTANVMDS